MKLFVSVILKHLRAEGCGVKVEFEMANMVNCPIARYLPFGIAPAAKSKFEVRSIINGATILYGCGARFFGPNGVFPRLCYSPALSSDADRVRLKSDFGIIAILLQKVNLQFEE